jgi:hypothetical protein
VENPNCITVINIFVVHLLACLIEANRYLLFFFFRGGPCVEDRFLLKIEVVVLNFESLVDFDVEKGSGVEGNVDIDILLVIEAGLQIEDAELGGDFE